MNYGFGFGLDSGNLKYYSFQYQNSYLSSYPFLYGLRQAIRHAMCHKQDMHLIDKRAFRLSYLSIHTLFLQRKETKELIEKPDILWFRHTLEQVFSFYLVQIKKQENLAYDCNQEIARIYRANPYVLLHEKLMQLETRKIQLTTQTLRALMKENLTQYVAETVLKKRRTGAELTKEDLLLSTYSSQALETKMISLEQEHWKNKAWSENRQSVSIRHSFAKSYDDWNGLKKQIHKIRYTTKRDIGFTKWTSFGQMDDVWFFLHKTQQFGWEKSFLWTNPRHLWKRGARMDWHNVLKHPNNQFDQCLFETIKISFREPFVRANWLIQWQFCERSMKILHRNPELLARIRERVAIKEPYFYNIWIPERTAKLYRDLLTKRVLQKGTVFALDSAIRITHPSTYLSWANCHAILQRGTSHVRDNLDAMAEKKSQQRATRKEIEILQGFPNTNKELSRLPLDHLFLHSIRLEQAMFPTGKFGIRKQRELEEIQAKRFGFRNQKTMNRICQGAWLEHSARFLQEHVTEVIVHCNEYSFETLHQLYVSQAKKLTDDTTLPAWISFQILKEMQIYQKPSDIHKTLRDVPFFDAIHFLPLIPRSVLLEVIQEPARSVMRNTGFMFETEHPLLADSCPKPMRIAWMGHLLGKNAKDLHASLNDGMEFECKTWMAYVPREIEILDQITFPALKGRKGLFLTEDSWVFKSIKAKEMTLWATDLWNTKGRKRWFESMDAVDVVLRWKDFMKSKDLPYLRRDFIDIREFPFSETIQRTLNTSDLPITELDSYRTNRSSMERFPMELDGYKISKPSSVVEYGMDANKALRELDLEREKDPRKWAWVYEPPNPFTNEIDFSIDELLLPENDVRYESLQNQLFNFETLRPIRPIKQIDDCTFVAKYPIKHPIPDWSDVGIQYLPVHVSVLRKIFVKFYEIWMANIFKFGNMTMVQSVHQMLDYMYAWITTYLPLEEIEEGLRVFRLLRWYGETSILQNSQYIIKYEMGDAATNLNSGECCIPYHTENMVLDQKLGVFRTESIRQTSFVEFYLKNKETTTISFSMITTIGSVKVYCNEELLDVCSNSGQNLTYEIPPCDGEDNVFRIEKEAVCNQNLEFYVGHIIAKRCVAGELSITFDPTLRTGNRPLDDIAKKMIEYANLHEDFQYAYEEIRKQNLGISELYKLMTRYWDLHHKNKEKGKRWTIKEI